MNKKFLLVSIVCLFSGFFQTNALAKSSYDGLPGVPSSQSDEYLKEFGDKLQRSTNYQFFYEPSGKNTELFVFETKQINGNNIYSWVNFGTADSAEIKVRYTGGPLDSYEIRPKSYGIKATQKGNEVTFTLKRTLSTAEATQVVFMPNGDRSKSFFICANPEEVLPDSKKVTHYFKAGTVTYIPAYAKEKGLPLDSGDDLASKGPRNNLVLNDGDSIYIEDGAVVVGGFTLADMSIPDGKGPYTKTASFDGRGIVYLGNEPHREDRRVLRLDCTHNVSIKGIVFTQCPGWIISAWNGTVMGNSTRPAQAGNTQLTVDNVKTIGQWHMNTDGVQTGTDGLKVTGCCFQCNDDATSLHEALNVQIYGCVFMTATNGSIFNLGWCGWTNYNGRGLMKHFDIHDCTVVYNQGSGMANSPFCIILYNNSAPTIEDIHFENIYVQQLSRSMEWISYEWQNVNPDVYPAPHYVRDITFKNVVFGDKELSGTVKGCNETNVIEGVVFDNVSFDDGAKILSSASQANLNVVNAKVTFINPPPATPVGLQARQGDTVVSLNWTSNTEDDISHYTVYRASQKIGPFTKIAADVATSDYMDSGLSNGKAYFYAIAAVDQSGGESDKSGAVSATPAQGPPVPPTGMKAKSGDTIVDLDWNDNADPDLAGYNLYRGTAASGPYTKIAEKLTSSNYQDTGLSNGETYYYAVAAVDTSGDESGKSDDLSIIPNPIDIDMTWTLVASENDFHYLECKAYPGEHLHVTDTTRFVLDDDISNNSRWKFEDAGDGAVYIWNQYFWDSYRLCSPDGIGLEMKSGKPVEDGAKWIVERLDDGGFCLVNKASGKKLRSADGQTRFELVAVVDSVSTED